MYRTCIYCHKSLGVNESIEAFPVGRRLAFDASKGRLWVVCRACERWNLTPLDARWEAIEACERAFSGTRLRVSTDNIGMARMKDGLDLVRIGEPARPEFAAWRYGDQFGRRRRKAILIGTGAVAAMIAVIAGASAAGIGIGGFGGLWGNLPNLIRASRKIQVRADDGRLVTVRGSQLPAVRFFADRYGDPVLQWRSRGAFETFQGGEAVRLAGQILPAINSAGGNRETVATAVRALEASRGPDAFVQNFLAARSSAGRRNRLDEAPPVAKAEGAVRLALEMALHEETERRAIEGELALLEAAWRDAESIAGIADNLLVPPEVEQRLDEMKRAAGPQAPPRDDR